jgi:hypothetical protein
MFIGRRRLAEDAHTILSVLGTSGEEVAASFVTYGIRVGDENSSRDVVILLLECPHRRL